MGGVLVDDDDAVAGLGQDIGLVHLGPRRAQRVVDGIEHRGRRALLGDARLPVRLGAGGDLGKPRDRLDGGGERALGLGLPAALAPGGMAGGWA